MCCRLPNYIKEWILIFIKTFFDRIYRINRIFIIHFLMEMKKTNAPMA